MKSRRPRVALPAGVRLDDMEWESPRRPKKKPPVKMNSGPKLSYPDWLKRKAQDRLAMLRRLNNQWQKEEMEYYQRKAKELAAEIERDRVWLERQNALEAELTAIQTYYKTELEKEQAAEDKRRREKLKSVIRDISADVCRTERETLARRGQIRGRRA